jgi:ureidoacrylate peracid hydrolase
MQQTLAQKIIAGPAGRDDVASTVRSAHMRDFKTMVLSEGCAAFSQATHDSAIADLSTAGKVMTCAEAQVLIEVA